VVPNLEAEIMRRIKKSILGKLLYSRPCSQFRDKLEIMGLLFTIPILCPRLGAE